MNRDLAGDAVLSRPGGTKSGRAWGAEAEFATAKLSGGHATRASWCNAFVMPAAKSEPKLQLLLEKSDHVTATTKITRIHRLEKAAGYGRGQSGRRDPMAGRSCGSFCRPIKRLSSLGSLHMRVSPLVTILPRCHERKCNERIKSYFSHTYPSLQSLAPTLSPLQVRFLRVYLQADPSRLLVATAVCKHQSRATQSSSKRSYNITDLRTKPPTMPHGNDSCTQARFAVPHTRVRSSSGSFFPRLVLCVFGLRP